MNKVTLKWGGEAIIGTWEDRPMDPGYGYVFRGRTNDGKKSEWMKKRELRDWFAKEGAK